MSPQTERVLLRFAWAGIAVFVLFLGGVWVAVEGADLRDYLFPEPFDRECWDRYVGDEVDAECSRWRMRYSLVREHELVGMSRSEVRDLVGGSGSGRVTSIPMGMSNHGISTGRLELQFDGSGRVESYEFVEG